MPAHLPIIIGLTGGIASGKSTVASFLSQIGVAVVDADQVAREVTTPGTQAMDKIISEFGKEYLKPDGTLDRAKLGSMVFSNPEALQKLEEITHPAINAASQALFRALKAQGHQFVVYEATLILECDLTESLNMAALIVTCMDHDKRMNILLHGRQMAPHLAQQRINAQLPDQARVARADYVIDTSSSLEETRKRTLSVWRSIKQRFGQGNQR